MQFQSNIGELFIVSTPIGNLEDITLRAIRTLKEADLIITEDTRNFKKLANVYQINTPVQSYHDHNEHSKSNDIINKLQSGSKIALVSDAGTPLINDPGYRLASKAKSLNIKITPIPGASSILAAIVTTGFAIDQFSFLGFAPVKEGQKSKLFSNIINNNQTTILLESPHRILKSLSVLKDIDPQCPVSVCRELTKIHEESVSGTAEEVFDIFNRRDSIKGEIVMIIGRKLS